MTALAYRSDHHNVVFLPSDRFKVARDKGRVTTAQAQFGTLDLVVGDSSRVPRSWVTADHLCRGNLNQSSKEDRGGGAEISFPPSTATSRGEVLSPTHVLMAIGRFTDDDEATKLPEQSTLVAS